MNLEFSTLRGGVANGPGTRDFKIRHTYVRTNMALFAWLVHDHKSIINPYSAGSPAAVPLVNHSAMWTPRDKLSVVPGCAFTKCRRVDCDNGERERVPKQQQWNASPRRSRNTVPRRSVYRVYQAYQHIGDRRHNRKFIIGPSITGPGTYMGPRDWIQKGSAHRGA